MLQVFTSKIHLPPIFVLSSYLYIYVCTFGL